MKLSSIQIVSINLFLLEWGKIHVGGLCIWISRKNKIWQKCVALRNKTVLNRAHAYWPWTNHASCPRYHSILQMWHHPLTSGVKLCHVCQIHYMWFENTMTFLYLNIISLGFYTKHSFVQWCEPPGIRCFSHQWITFCKFS